MPNLKEILLPMSVQTLVHGSRRMDAVTSTFDSQDSAESKWSLARM